MIERYRSVFKECGHAAVWKSLLTGIVLSLIIMAPLFALLINLWMLFIYRVYLFTTLIILAASGFMFLASYLTHKTLSFSRENDTKAHRFWLYHGVTLAGAIFVIGIVLMILLVPVYL